MKIKSIEVKGLSGYIDAEYVLKDDINIITGINGSGKTTLIKLIWYIISGNSERIAPEINFQYIRLLTDIYEVTLEDDEGNIKWEYRDEHIKQSSDHEIGGDEFHNERIEILNQLVIEQDTHSLYFPTFRRIEGGYSMGNSRRVRRRIGSGRYITEFFEHDDIQNEMGAVADRLSVRDHKFICSISTHDIVSLLTKRYALVSEKLNEHYKNFSTAIIGTIQGAKQKGKRQVETESFDILNDIQDKADNINSIREELLKPFAVLSELTAKIFRHKGIKVRTVTLGESVDAIDSGTLSAGEKQMLSFLCYNAFYYDTIIFIDEPELSLHPDWQRRLFPTLLKQQPTNQFIVATHSPFIYAKYEDKELAMNVNKGE